MKVRSLVKVGYSMGCLLAMFIMFLLYAVSWAVTCGIVFLVTLCFGWPFNLLIGTGVWLVLVLLKHIF